MMGQTGSAQPRLQKKMSTSANSIPSDAALSADNNITYHPESKCTTARKTRSWSARSRLTMTEAKEAEIMPKRSRCGRRQQVPRIPKIPVSAMKVLKKATNRSRAGRKIQRLKRRAHVRSENHASTFFRHLQTEQERKGSVSVKSFKSIARCHLPLQRGELNALVLLSSAADDSDRISVKAAMLALEEPKALSSGTMFDVKERLYPKTLSRTVTLLKQNPCKKPAMSKFVSDAHTAEAMRAMLTTRKLTDRGRRRQDFRTWITANTIKVGKRI